MTILVTVGDRPVTLMEAMNWLHFYFPPETHFLDFLVEQVAIANEATARGHEATAEDLRMQFAEIRYGLRLESGDALRQWMAERQVELANIQSACELTVKRRKLRAEITDEEIAGFYAEHKPLYERVELYRICVDQEDVARELHAQITEEDESFCLTAIEQSTDQETAVKGGYVGEVSRKQLPGEIEAAVFGANPGDVVGPVKTATGWQVLMVHASRTISLEEMKVTIRDKLFENVISRVRARTPVVYNYAQNQI